ncbi:MAG TPA: hypothetical protein VGI26_10510 [Solirubrobacteraceae bacterium]|jgi:hypothetical protein
MPADPVTPIAAGRLEVEEPLRCVWSGFPHYDRSCRSRIPMSVVVKAWHREMQLKGTEEGFFYFSWRSGVWLAYGLADGGVRGVYCPTHCSERDSRETPEEAQPVERPVGIALQ